METNRESDKHNDRGPISSKQVAPENYKVEPFSWDDDPVLPTPAKLPHAKVVQRLVEEFNGRNSPSFPIIRRDELVKGEFFIEREPEPLRVSENPATRTLEVRYRDKCVQIDRAALLDLKCDPNEMLRGIVKNTLRDVSTKSSDFVDALMMGLTKMDLEKISNVSREPVTKSLTFDELRKSVALCDPQHPDHEYYKFIDKLPE